MSHSMTSLSRRGRYGVESLEGRKLMTANTSIRLMNEAAVIAQLTDPSNVHTTQEATLVRRIEASERSNTVGLPNPSGVKAGGGDGGAEGLGDPLQQDGPSGVGQAGAGSQQRIVDRIEGLPEPSDTSDWVKVKGLDLENTTNTAGSGSFKIAADSRMAAIIDLAIEEGVKSLDFQVETVAADGRQTAKRMEITFDSISPNKGLPQADLDVVDFTFTHEAKAKNVSP